MSQFRNGQGAFATEADQEQSTTESTENTNRRSGRKRKSANYEGEFREPIGDQGFRQPAI